MYLRSLPTDLGGSQLLPGSDQNATFVSTCSCHWEQTYTIRIDTWYLQELPLEVAFPRKAQQTNYVKSPRTTGAQYSSCSRHGTAHDAPALLWLFRHCTARAAKKAEHQGLKSSSKLVPMKPWRAVWVSGASQSECCILSLLFEDDRVRVPCF